MIMLNKIITVSAVFGAMSAQAMEAAGPAGYDSLTVQGVFSPAIQQAIQAPVNAGMAAAKAEFSQFPKPKKGDQEGYFFFQTDPKNYHLTINIVEPTAADKQTGGKLGEFHISMLKEAAKADLKTTYAGHIFLFQMWAHGYDAQGNGIDKKYANPGQVDNGSVNPAHEIQGLDNDFPCGISKIEFVHRYGTGKPGQAGQLKLDTTVLVGDINNLNEIFINPYQGKYDDFSGHMTAGTIKKQLKGAITANSPRFVPGEYQTLKNVYKHLHQGWRANNNNVFTAGRVHVHHLQLAGRQIVNGKVNDSVIIPNIHS